MLCTDFGWQFWIVIPKLVYTSLFLFLNRLYEPKIHCFWWSERKLLQDRGLHKEIQTRELILLQLLQLLQLIFEGSEGSLPFRRAPFFACWEICLFSQSDKPFLLQWYALSLVAICLVRNDKGLSWGLPPQRIIPLRRFLFACVWIFFTFALCH